MQRGMRLLAGLVLIVALIGAGLASATAVSAGEKGQKIGQDPVRLALTKCSNAGIGNGGEFEAALVDVDFSDPSITVYSLYSECLEKEFGDELTEDEVAAILQQGGCDVLAVIIAPPHIYVVGACEIDPGNSAAHNNAQK